MKNYNNKFDVITVGGATEDIAYYAKESLVIKNPNKKDIRRQRLLAFEYGTKFVMDEIDVGLGGGACNAAVSFRRLGLKTSTIICLGKDNAGQKIYDGLKKEKINTKFIQLEKEKQSGFSFIIASAEERGHTIFAYRGANKALKISPALLKKIKTRFFYVSSWSQNSWRKDLDMLIKHKGGARVAWNPGGTQLRAGKSGMAKYLKSIDVFNVNKDEAIELVVSDKSIKNRSKKQLNNARSLLDIMKSWGPEIIVITDGRKGAYASSQGKTFYLKAPKVKLVDTTGAGDAFGSAFVAGLIMYNNDVKKALELGIKNSSSVVQKIGAQKGLLRL